MGKSTATSARQAEVNKIIEAAAKALHKKYGFNRDTVLASMHLFSTNFFENTPKIPTKEKFDWVYLRDSWSHAALLFNTRTNAIRLIQKSKYWTKAELRYYRMTNSERRKADKID